MCSASSVSTRRIHRWSAEAGLCTRAFEDWRFSEKGLRAFLKFGLSFAETGYTAIWDRLSKEPGGEDGPDLIDLFDEETDGFSSTDFEWLLLASSVRDGVTLLEVYLESVLHELVDTRIHETKIGESSPRWQDLRLLFRHAFAIDLEAPAVKPVLDLRHLLTHRRGELKAEPTRRRYDRRVYDFPDQRVHLDLDAVLKHLEAVSGKVIEVDRKLFPLAWGREEVDHDLHDALLLYGRWLFET